MNMISVVSMFSFFIYISTGVYILKADYKNNSNRILFILSILLALTTFVTSFGYSSETVSEIQFSFNISFIFYMFYFPVLIIFCLNITENQNIQLYCWSFIPFIILITIFAAGNFNLIKFVKRNSLWELICRFDNIYFPLFISYAFIYKIVCFIILINSYFKAQVNKTKRVYIIVSIGIIAGFIISVSEAFIFKLTLGYQSFGLSPVLNLIWYICLLYAILKFRFLSLTPEAIASKLVNSVKESILLIDTNLNIKYCNNYAKTVLERPEINDLNEIVFECDIIKQRIQNMIDLRKNELSCFLNILNTNGNKILMNSHFSLIIDKYDDIIGLLLICRVVKDRKHLNTIYNITTREIEVIELVLNGKSGKEVAVILDITLRTVKAHLKNIYDKLGVDNKYHMISLLNEYDLITDSKLEEQVFILNNKPGK